MVAYNCIHVVEHLIQFIITLFIAYHYNLISRLTNHIAQDEHCKRYIILKQKYRFCATMHCTNNITITIFIYLVTVEECDKGSYGIECTETCGHCHDVKQCSNVNGYCLTGCDDGYEGDFCKSRE